MLDGKGVCLGRGVLKFRKISPARRELLLGFMYSTSNLDRGVLEHMSKVGWRAGSIVICTGTPCVYPSIFSRCSRSEAKSKSKSNDRYHERKMIMQNAPKRYLALTTRKV